jgi:hypothetical protein
LAVWVVAFGAAGTSVGCHSVFGLDDYEVELQSATGGATSGPGGGGGASGGSGGDAGGGAGGADGGGGGTPVPAEDCCVDPNPPAGWSLVAASTAPGSEPAAPCLAGAEGQLLFSGAPVAHTCSACSCAAPTGGSCASELICSETAGCTTSVYNVGDRDDCMSAFPEPVPQYCYAQGTVVTGMTCPPSGGTPELTPWQSQHLACPAIRFDDQVCPDGAECFGGAAGAELCLVKEGDEACPPGDVFTERSLVYASAVDARGCDGSCACAPSNTTCSTPSYRMFGNVVACGFNSGGILVSSTTCTAVSGGDFINRLTDSAPIGSECTPTVASPNPTGTFTPADPWTMCCQAPAE